MTRRDKRRPLPVSWSKHFSEVGTRLTEGEQLVSELEAKANKVLLDIERMRTHLMTSVVIFGEGMKNPRLSDDGLSVEGD